MNKNSWMKYMTFQDNGEFVCYNFILSYILWPLIIFIRDFLTFENKQ